jgi:hypothetical protein
MVDGSLVLCLLVDMFVFWMGVLVVVGVMGGILGSVGMVGNMVVSSYVILFFRVHIYSSLFGDSSGIVGMGGVAEMSVVVSVDSISCCGCVGCGSRGNWHVLRVYWVL